MFSIAELNIAEFYHSKFHAFVLITNSVRSILKLKINEKCVLYERQFGTIKENISAKHNTNNLIYN